MAVSTHLQELTSKHSNLDKEIQSIQKSPVPDTIRLTALKKEKLYLKERIQTFQSAS